MVVIKGLNDCNIKRKISYIHINSPFLYFYKFIYIVIVGERYEIPM